MKWEVLDETPKWFVGKENAVVKEQQLEEIDGQGDEQESEKLQSSSPKGCTSRANLK